MYKQIIWDWNGTLWNDTWLCVEINNHMLARRELPLIDINLYRATLCFPVTDYYSQLGFNYETDPYPRLADEFIAEYEQRRFECELHPEARAMIDLFHTLEIPQAVLSAYEQNALLEATNWFKLTGCFTDIIGLDDIYAAGKVENGTQYIAKLNVDPNEVLFIGDTLHDFEVAEAMGVQCILVANGHNNRARLETSGVPVFDSLTGLKNLLSK